MYRYLLKVCNIHKGRRIILVKLHLSVKCETNTNNLSLINEYIISLSVYKIVTHTIMILI